MDYGVINVDKLMYAGNLEFLDNVDSNERYQFERADITEAHLVDALFGKYRPLAVMHLAAKSHVDHSIDGPGEFIQTNIVGTFNLLQAARRYYVDLDQQQQEMFRFHHISTDEVYGSLDHSDPGFSETTPNDPHSPYSASKAASDHLVCAWHDTYGLPVLITNCSNNYGPFKFPEKLILVVILKALHGQPIPVYGTRKNVRDWLYITDHARALLKVLESGTPGKTYNIGRNNERTNIDLVRTLCGILDRLVPIANNEQLTDQQCSDLSNYSDLIMFVTDRNGHDLHYAINANKIKDELDWEPLEDPDSGFEKTVS